MEIDFENLPPGRHPSERVIDSCIYRAADHYELNPLVLKAVRRQEAGKVGMANRNTDDTYDLGVMQLNTTNLDKILRNFPQISAYDLIYKACVNVFVGAWFLKGRIDRANGDVWRGVGNYHSGTPHLHHAYREKVQDHYRKIREEYLSAKQSRAPQAASRQAPRRRSNVIGIYQSQ